jgi:small neutral amino acid transporter SnatA (MarC family)
MGRRSDDEVFRITGARSSLTEDVRGRQRRYVISMLIRTVCVLLAVVLWNVERYLAFAALAGGVLLPYIAVVIANAGRERAPGLPSTFDVPPTTPLMLGPGGQGGQGGSGAPESPGTEDL